MRRITMILFALLASLFMQAQVRIAFTCSAIDPKAVGNGNPRGPIEAPTIYIEDYSLSFEANHPDYVLYIKDEDGDVVYTTTVYSAVTLVPLPSTLSGDYEIELVYGGWIFTGNISL